MFGTCSQRFAFLFLWHNDDIVHQYSERKCRKQAYKKLYRYQFDPKQYTYTVYTVPGWRLLRVGIEHQFKDQQWCTTGGNIICPSMWP